jgi:hypothetical protein
MTARQVEAQQSVLTAWLSEAGLAPSGSGGLVLTGSGSSLYVGECLVVPIQRALQRPVSAVSSGELLTHQDAHLASARRGVVVSFARSGDSPESSAVVQEVLAVRPAWHHLIITCNGAGRLAHSAGRDGVRALVLTTHLRSQPADDEQLHETWRCRSVPACPAGAPRIARASSSLPPSRAAPDGLTDRDGRASGFRSAVSCTGARLDRHANRR